jgi:hypothetical protein
VQVAVLQTCWYDMYGIHHVCCWGDSLRMLKGSTDHHGSSSCPCCRQMSGWHGNCFELDVPAWKAAICQQFCLAISCCAAAIWLQLSFSCRASPQSSIKHKWGLDKPNSQSIDCCSSTASGYRSQNCPAGLTGHTHGASLSAGSVMGPTHC